MRVCGNFSLPNRIPPKDLAAPVGKPLRRSIAWFPSNGILPVPAWYRSPLLKALPAKVCLKAMVAASFDFWLSMVSDATASLTWIPWLNRDHAISSALNPSPRRGVTFKN